MTAPIWFLAWVGFGLLFGILVAEVWIRLRDGYSNDPIELDAEDAQARPLVVTVNGRLDARTAEVIREALIRRGEGRPTPDL